MCDVWNALILTQPLNHSWKLIICEYQSPKIVSQPGCHSSSGSTLVHLSKWNVQLSRAIQLWLGCQNQWASFCTCTQRHNLKPTMFTCSTDISQSNKGSPFLDGGWLKTDLLIISKLSTGAFRQNSLFMVMVTSKEVTTQTLKACFGTLNTSDTFNAKISRVLFLEAVSVQNSIVTYKGSILGNSDVAYHNKQHFLLSFDDPFSIIDMNLVNV